MSNSNEHQLSAGSKNKRNLLIVISLSGTYLVAEIIGGMITQSLALLADASHMLTDVGGLILAYFAIKLGERNANTQKTYGYYRAEILATVINAVVLIGISLYVLYEAYQRFQNPPKVQSKEMLIVAIVGLVVNIVGMFILRQGSQESLNMKGAYFEVLSDMLTSIGVIIAGIIMLTTGWYYADPIISAGIGILIFPRTWVLLKDAINVLMEGSPTDVDIVQLRKTLSETQGVKEVHDLHIWTLTSGINAMSVHIITENITNSNELLKTLTDKVKADFKISHTTFQIEPNSFAEKEVHL